MRHKIKHISQIGLSLLALFAMIVSAGCSDEIESGLAQDAGAGYITINLRNAKAGSRAADNTRNEDLIESAVICLYPNGGASAATVPAYVEFIDNIKLKETASVKVKLSKSLATALFGEGNGNCTAYVIANLPDYEAQKITTSTPLESLKKIVVNPDFASMQPQPSFVMDGTATVTRTGAGTTADKATGVVELTRAASKISLAVKVTDEYVDGTGARWVPDVDNISVLITNGVTRSQVESSTYDVTSADYYRTQSGAQDANHRARSFTRQDGDEYPYLLSSPFYTFPNKWDAADVESPMTYMTLLVPWKKDGEQRYRTCYYMVPVIKGSELVRNMAYSVKLSVNVLGSFTPDVPMPLDDLSYYAVEWGSVGIDVDMNESRYLVVDRHNYVMDNEEYISIPVYTSHETIVTDINMTFRRYNTSDAGNEYSVHVSKALIEASNKPYIDEGKTTRLCEASFKNVSELNPNASIEFTHTLDIWEPYNGNTKITQRNLQGSTITIFKPSDPIERAYSRYTIEITIQHKDIYERDGSAFKETIVIEQYPPMYIESDQNHTGERNKVVGRYRDWRWTWHDVTINTFNDSRYGNVYINNNNNTDVYWGEPSTLSGENSNPNMYLIHTTQLDANTRYIIGDPRMADVDISYFNDITIASAPHINGNGAIDNNAYQLSKYHPTDPSKDQYIAPVFRVASSWGKSYSMSKEDAIRRCASYQEKDCPAGRWRLPTRSELEYIMILSDSEKIPMLFNLYDTDAEYVGSGRDITYQNGYWTAQGRVVQKPSVTGGVLKISKDNNTASVRCVYDEWYWKDKVPQSGTIEYYHDESEKNYDTGIPYYPFTWGD